MTRTVHLAPVVLTMAGPPLDDGAVLVEGDRVLAVGPRTEVPAEGARERTHPGVLLPGLAVASVGLPDGAPDDTATARGVVHALLRAGVTCLGSAPPGVLRAAAAAGLTLGAGGPGLPGEDPLLAARSAQGTPEERVRAATGGAVLAPGGRADLAVFDVPPGGDPYAALLADGPGRCVATLAGGRLVHRR